LIRLVDPRSASFPIKLPPHASNRVRVKAVRVLLNLAYDVNAQATNAWYKL
jgi:hypothetical protein